jgi:hypothetical protein
MKVKTLQKHFTPIASHWTSVRRSARGRDYSPPLRRLFPTALRFIERYRTTMILGLGR